MEKLMTFTMSVMPLLFGFGFLVPVMQQGIIRVGWTPPLGFSPLDFSLMVCGGWAILAQWRKRWI